jgi:phage/plasmid-like protein (TIGR03299 family)
MFQINLTETYGEAHEMAHGLEIDAKGVAKMAYADREIPWHRLGVAMKGLQTADAMLAAAQADYDVVTTKVAVVDADGNLIRNPDGTAVVIEDSRATVRVNPDGSFDGLATVGTRYVVQQNRECLDYALAIVGASKGEAIVDTCGVLDGGREFFSSLDLGQLVIDPTGINDKIERYLLVRNGHDGKTPITFANTSIRAVCKNTVIAGMSSAPRVFTARHTRNADHAIEEAQKVLEISTEWAKSFKETAEKLLAISVPANSQQLTKILDGVFPTKPTDTDRQRKNRDQVVTLVRGVYGNERNGAGYGYNGWSAYNAIVEYLDHYRDAKVDERALASMNNNSWVTNKKVLAQQVILSLA